MIEFEKKLLENPVIKYVIDEIKKRICMPESAIQMDYYYNHILLCAYYATELSKENNIEAEQQVISALLHDIARVNSDWIANHEYYGAKEADEILQTISYDQDKIALIKESIKNHKEGIRVNQNILTQVTADADAISFLENTNYFIDYEKTRNNDIETWLSLKLEDICGKISQKVFLEYEETIRELKKGMKL